jgi:NitT/TauT family transport system substrate-binding protein
MTQGDEIMTKGDEIMKRRGPERWSRRRFVRDGLLGAAALATGGRAAAADPPPETRRIRLIQTFAVCEAPQYVAEELLRAEGFTDVQYILKEGPAAIGGAIASGEADVSMHFSASLIQRIDRGEQVTLLAGIHPGCYELFTARPMRSLLDLKGRSVAIRAHDGPEQLFLASMMAYVGLDPRRDVNWVTYPAPRSIELLAEGKVDAFLGFPPQPQDMRARRIGHLLVNSNSDRPWNGYFCCMLAGHRPFVRANPIATRRALRAILKATDICAQEPERAARIMVDTGRTPRYTPMRQALDEVRYDRWRTYNPEDTVRFYALRLHEAGMIRSTPQKILEQGADWRFLDRIRAELKA